MPIFSIPLPWGVCLIQRKFLSSFSQALYGCMWPWTPWLFWPLLLLFSLLALFSPFWPLWLCKHRTDATTCEHFVTLAWNALSTNTQEACSLTSFEALCKCHRSEMHTFSVSCFYILQMDCFFSISFFALEHKLHEGKDFVLFMLYPQLVGQQLAQKKYFLKWINIKHQNLQTRSIMNPIKQKTYTEM